MTLSGIGCNRRFAKAMKRLKDGGFIIETHGNRYTLVERGGVGILKSFLFSEKYTATEKVYNILHYLRPSENKEGLAAILRVSARTLRRCRIVEERLYLAGEYGTKPQSADGQNRNTSNPKAQEINKTTYTNLFGQADIQPEKTNPEVVILSMREKERQETEQVQALRTATVKENSLDLFSEMPEYEKLSQELRQVFKNAPAGHIQQAVYQAIKNRDKVKTTLFAYAYGILRQNLKQYGNRPESPTIRSVVAIRNEIKSKRDIDKQREKGKRESLEKKYQDDKIMSMNKAYLENLPTDIQNMVEKEMVKIGNPLNLPFISDAFAKTAALTFEDLQERLLIIV